MKLLVKQNMVEKKSEFHKRLKGKTHKLIVKIYKITDKFPKSELYGCTSQVRRAVVSVMLNYLEGFARFKPKVQLNFYEISYGSSKEVKYLVVLSYELGWINEAEYNNLLGNIDEINGMLFSLVKGKQNDIK